MPIASHARLRILLSIAAIVALVSAVAIVMVSRGGITHAASSSSIVTFKGTHQTATRAAQKQVPMQATATTTPSGKTRVRVTPIFKKVSVNTVHAAAVQGSAPHVANMGFGKSKLLHNFHGLNSVDNFNA
ncbi:MAG TPA: hypothetical protein VGT82_00960, partial [Ktedonobacteraceae bacterium]|nr:hypothetical protein [Ktedonobacteraceae bacterium]